MCTLSALAEGAFTRCDGGARDREAAADGAVVAPGGDVHCAPLGSGQRRRRRLVAGACSIGRMQLRHQHRSSARCSARARQPGGRAPSARSLCAAFRRAFNACVIALQEHGLDLRALAAVEAALAILQAQAADMAAAPAVWILT